MALLKPAAASSFCSSAVRHMEHWGGRVGGEQREERRHRDQDEQGGTGHNGQPEYSLRLWNDSRMWPPS